MRHRGISSCAGWSSYRERRKPRGRGASRHAPFPCPHCGSPLRSPSPLTSSPIRERRRGYRYLHMRYQNLQFNNPSIAQQRASTRQDWQAQMSMMSIDIQNRIANSAIQNPASYQTGAGAEATSPSRQFYSEANMNRLAQAAQRMDTRRGVIHDLVNEDD